MQQRALGRSDVAVSRIGLGAATWGTRLDEDGAGQLLRRFVAAGGNLVDTADNYGRGRSEKIIGSLLRKVVPRSSVVVATKAGAIAGNGSFRHDASRGHLLRALDGSLRRLATDYVDLWQIHVWDAATPLDDTLEAIDTAVASGRVRCAGVSNYCGWQLAKAAASPVGQAPGRLVSCQMEYSLLERGIERELVPAAFDAGISVLAWAPLGRGVLTGKYTAGIPAERAQTWFFNWYVKPRLNGEATAPTVRRVMEVADELGTTPQAVALAWARDRPAVASAIVGARSADQLEASLAAESLDLPVDARERLDEVSAPHIAYPEQFLPD